MRSASAGCTGTSCWTVSFLLFVSASYTPLPGASGAQEGGFLIFFAGAFTQGTIGLALLVWRFFSYYLFLLVGALISIVGSLRGHFADRDNSGDEEEAPPESPRNAGETPLEPPESAGVTQELPEDPAETPPDMEETQEHKG